MSTSQPRRSDALDQLPLPYATALRLRDAGLDEQLIAECVGVEPEAVSTLMRVAEAKLSATGYHDPVPMTNATESDMQHCR